MLIKPTHEILVLCGAKEINVYLNFGIGKPENHVGTLVEPCQTFSDIREEAIFKQQNSTHL